VARISIFVLFLLSSVSAFAQVVGQGTPGDPSRPWFVEGVVSGTVTVDAGSGTFTVGAVNLDTRDLLFATDKVDVSGSTVTATGSGNFTVVQPTGTNLHVVCDSGCGGAATFADDDPFTFGTTSIGNVGFVFDDAAPNAVTENSAAAARISSRREIYTQLRDAAGNERGANVSAGNALHTNLAEVAGNTISTGVGASGTGTQRVAAIIHDGTDTALVNAGGELNVVLNSGSSVTGVGSLLANGFDTSAIKTEDSPHATVAAGVYVLGVRNDGSSTQLTNANADYGSISIDAYGAVYRRPDHPNRVACVVSSTATTSAIVTGCSAPGAGLSIYITSLQWHSSIISTTTNFMTIQSGTGGTCGASIDVLYRGYSAPAFSNTNIVFQTPIKAPANEEICLLHPGAGTRLVNIQGFIAP